MRVFLSVALCRLARFTLRLFGRGGTSFPGKVALRIYPELLRALASDVKSVVVTGTNGKTTSARIIEEALRLEGLEYFTNRSGANLLSGVTSEFAANATLTGKPKRSYAVIECDEAAAKKVCEYLNPSVVLVTNVFRDQLDRFAELTETLESIRTSLGNSPNAAYVLSADCSMCASLSDDLAARTVYFGVETPIYKEQASEQSDAPRCIKCGAPYEYSYLTYAHLGGFKCTGCGYSRPHADVAVTGIIDMGEDGSRVAMRVMGESREAFINLPGGYNIYNAAGACAAAIALGLSADSAVSALGSFECGFGRMEKLSIGGQDVRMILVKNPAGCNQVINYLTNIDSSDLIFAACLNDKIADGTDVSWIWDADFETLRACGKFKEVLVSGIRADEMALRLKYAGFPSDSIFVVRDYETLLSELLLRDKRIFIMPTYTAMLELRSLLCAKYGLRDFWE